MARVHRTVRVRIELRQMRGRHVVTGRSCHCGMQRFGRIVALTVVRHLLHQGGNEPVIVALGHDGMQRRFDVDGARVLPLALAIAAAD